MNLSQKRTGDYKVKKTVTIYKLLSYKVFSLQNGSLKI